MGLLFVKAVIPQLWKPLLITCCYLFLSLECQEEAALRKADALVSWDVIIHRDVENMLNPCVRPAFMSSRRTLTFTKGVV